MKLPRAFALLLAALVTLAVLAPPRMARADDEPKQEELPRRQANFAWDKNEKTNQTLLRASFSYRDVIDKAMADKLASGLPTVIAMRAYVLREGEANPVALAVRTCRVVYDLWDEVYRLKISGPGGERDTAALNLEGVLRQCAEARDLPVADKSLLTAGKPHFLGVIVEVNPVSPQMLAQMRQWVSRPAGSTGIGPGDALFGSFVGLFVRQLGNADRTLRFRTQSVTPCVAPLARDVLGTKDVTDPNKRPMGESKPCSDALWIRSASAPSSCAPSRSPLVPLPVQLPTPG